MKLSALRRCNPEYDGALLTTHHDLFAGGHQFQKNAGLYLPQHDVEPSQVYARRCAQAHYLGYIAPICNLFASWLFSCPLQLTSEPEDAAADPFWAELKEDCDGLGADLDQFLRGRFTEALQHRRAWARVAFPAPGERAPDSRAEWEQIGAGHAWLVAVPTRAITHWRRDDAGALLWAVEHMCCTRLEAFDDAASVTVETWTLWQADGTARRWELRHEAGKPVSPETVVPEVQPPYNPTGTLPLVELVLPPELWVVNLLASGQLEHFRKMCALSWAIDRTCYAMPVLKLRNARKPPTMGAGYYLMLGVEESLEWPAPPAAPFAAVQDYATKLREEMYRVTSQMAASVDNNAAAVGRSGESKQADNKATEMVLGAFGRPVREFAERLHDLVAMGRGESITWHVGGMDAYEHVDPDAEIARTAAAIDLGVPSETFRVELLTRAALAQLPDADEAKKRAVREEIAAGVAAKAARAAAAPPMPPPSGAAPKGQPPGTPVPPEAQQMGGYAASTD